MLTATSSDKIDLSSEKKTEELASKFSKKLKPGNVVFLYGEMGVGKTTFIRYLINKFQKDNKSEITEVLDIANISETVVTKYQKFDEIRVDFTVNNRSIFITVIK